MMIKIVTLIGDSLEMYILTRAETSFLFHIDFGGDKVRGRENVGGVTWGSG